MSLPVELNFTKGSLNTSDLPYSRYSPDLMKFLLREYKTLPTELSYEYLVQSQAPLEFVALTRIDPRKRLLEGMRPSNYWRDQYHTKESFEQNTLSFVASVCTGNPIVGELSEKESDSGETRTVAFPIDWQAGGSMMIEVNNAWGVHWFLKQPDRSSLLNQVQFQYDPKKNQRSDNRVKSIRPSSFAKYMEYKGFNIHDLACDIQSCLRINLGKSESTISTYGIDPTRFDRMGAILKFENPEHRNFSIEFALGAVYGDKAFRINDENNGNDLFRQIHAYDSLQSLGL